MHICAFPGWHLSDVHIAGLMGSHVLLVALLRVFVGLHQLGIVSLELLIAPLQTAPLVKLCIAQLPQACPCCAYHGQCALHGQVYGSLASVSN